MDLLRLISDFWWIAPIVGTAAIVYRFFGWRGVLVVLTFGVAKGLYTHGKRVERDRLERLAAAERSQSIADRKRVDDHVAKLDPNAVRDDLGRWVSDDPPR